MTPSAVRGDRFSRFVRMLAWAAAFGAAATAVQASTWAPRPAPGRLLLTLRDGVEFRPATAKPGSAAVTGAAGLDRLNAAFGVHAVTPLFAGETGRSKAIAGYDLTRYIVLEMDPAADLDAARAAYAADVAVAAAEFDMLMPIDLESNDFTQQWHLESTTGHDAHVTGGWNHSTGQSSVLLAIADSGVDWEHPDLAANIWTNTPEVNGTPGVDDDSNGLVDDVRGWDFVSSLGGAWPGEDASVQDNDPRDFNGHGTHVAGIAAAVTNNGIGVAGVGWNCRIMALRIGGSIDSGGTEQGVVLMSAAASALNYARVKGASAFNCSWGSSNSGGLGAAVSSAVAQGMVVVVAAGNDNGSGASYLSSRGDCMDVAATNNADVKAGFSNYGPWVDVCAPGVNIYSTYFDHVAAGAAQHTYTHLQGTSMAAPVVTGLVGLVKGSNPSLTGAQIRTLIVLGCDNINLQNPMHIGQLGAGRVNALRTFGDYYLTVPGDYPSFNKAMAASGNGDTLAFRGGDLFIGPWFVTRNNRTVLGGWDPGFSTRDPIGNPTLVQRLGVGPTLEFISGIDSSFVLDGFAFSNGVARDLATPLVGAFGGGVLCIDASPTLRGCRFESNTAGAQFAFGGGGGGFFSNSNSVLEDCIFTANAATAGGGLYAHNSSLRLAGGSIAANTTIGTGTTSVGSGVYVNGGTLFLDGVTVSDNTGAQEGGGFYVAAGALDATRVVCADNSAVINGGHVRVAGGQATFRGSDLRGASANFGGGFALAAGTTLALTSVAIVANQSAVIGAGVYAQSAHASFTNVTWHANHAAAGGGDALFASSSPSVWTLRNCLVTGHTSTINAACTFSGGTAPQLDYNSFFANAADIQGAGMGPNDTVADPLYVNAAAGDVALGLHSPAIDSGDPAILDFDGSRGDRGAYGGGAAEGRQPARPTGLLVTDEPAHNALAWSANGEGDIQSYIVYRGSMPDFVPSAATYVATVPAGSTQYDDTGGQSGHWYRLAAVDASAASSGFSVAVQTDVGVDSPLPTPQRFALHPNHPNPFNPSTTLRFDLVQASNVRLEVLDAGGRSVRVLASGWRDAGTHSVGWDGRDGSGHSVASGVYWSRLVAGPAVATRKMILVR